MRKCLSVLFLSFLSLLLPACGGGGGGSSSTPTLSASLPAVSSASTPTPGPVLLSVASLNLNAGQNTSFTASQKNYNGSFTASTSCSALTVSPATSTNGQFTVSASSGASTQSCMVTIDGGYNQTASLATTITVTISVPNACPAGQIKLASGQNIETFVVGQVYTDAFSNQCLPPAATDTYSYTFSNPGIASIAYANGVFTVTALAPGPELITITDNQTGATAGITFTVTQ